MLTYRGTQMTLVFAWKFWPCFEVLTFIES